MELFSEIYGKYYRIMALLLNNGKQTKIQIREAIRKAGFAETEFYFEPNLYFDPKTDKIAWPLFKENSSNEYEPIVNAPNTLPPTILEKAWIKAVLDDERAKLFLTSEEITDAKEKLGAIAPLYNDTNILNFDQFDVGDDYSSPVVQKHFSMLLEAMDESKAVQIKYLSAKGKNIEGVYIPCKFEYSPKNDKFRLLAVQIDCSGYRGYSVLNLNRIQNVEFSDIAVQEDYQEYFLKKRNKEESVLEIEIFDERNAMERFMVEFSNYRKEAMFDKDRDVLKVKLYFDKLDTIEILIKILGFGPVLKVLGPDDFVELIKMRLRMQKHLTRE